MQTLIKLSYPTCKGQIIHQTKDIGDDKVNSAKNKLTELNPEIKVTIANELIHTDNLNELIKGVDIVLDGTDNFESRFEINKVCVENKKPLISAAVVRFEGQVSVFKGHEKNLPCYQCLYSLKVKRMRAVLRMAFSSSCWFNWNYSSPSSNQSYIKLGDQLSGSLLLVDALDLSFRKVKIGKIQNVLFVIKKIGKLFRS